jgi:hypothetical protein
MCDGGVCINFSIDSLANAKTIWTRNCLSPPKVFNPLLTTQFGSNVPPGPSSTTTKTETSVLPIPGRKRHRINSKRRETRKHQPNIKKVTRILQNQPYSNTNYVDFQLKCREDTLAASFLVQSTHEQKKKSDKEESHKRLLPISNTNHPILPQQQPQCRVERSMHPKQGPASLV